ncbi:MAG: DUF4251 domain-containing protein [Marinilabiliaceae bacterium]|jgi:hypothetical protein|nr:DUF4251 domain-containing protein [Marinilabiliaceae bacterium]
MKNNILFLSAILALITMSCSSSAKLSRAEANELRGAMIHSLLENQHYVIKAEKMNLRRGGQLYLSETANYIKVNGDAARVNLAYMGRSYDLRGISGINMSGQITERSIVKKKNGNTLVSMRIEQNNDAFKFDILVSNSGRCTVNIYHPKIDPISYRGYFAALQ